MSDAATAVAVGNAGTSSWLDRHAFLLRRLHSLAGIVPIGAFVCFHLFTNMQMFFGSFQHEVNWIHSQPALLMMEIGVLWLPIAFHGVLGVVYSFTGRLNNNAYSYNGNWRYSVQRVTGYLAFIFIFLHVAIMRWRWDILGWYTPFFSKGVTATGGSVIDLATYSTSMALSYPAVLVLYVIGVMSAVFHWSNGLWTAAITWGLTVTPQAQKRWGYVRTGLFVALTVFTSLALTGALSYKDKAPDQERAAYAYMKQQYQAGKLNFEKIEAIAVAPSGTAPQAEH